MDERRLPGPEIHATAIVERGAELGEGVRIGPYCLVGPNVTLAAGVELVSHVIVAGHTAIGANTRIYPFASLGHPPQDLKYKGEETRLEIGANNTIREHATMNPGTAGGGGLTRVGSGGLFMIGTHVAHDCKVGDNVVMANNATLGGHVTVGDNVFFGGLCAVHQFARIGEGVMVAGVTGVRGDIIPFGYASGQHAKLVGINVVGMKRRGFGRADMHRLRDAHKELFSERGTFRERLDAAAEKYGDDPLIGKVIAFIKDGGSRALVQPPRAGSSEADPDQL